MKRLGGQLLAFRWAYVIGAIGGEPVEAHVRESWATDLRALEVAGEVR